MAYPCISGNAECGVFAYVQACAVRSGRMSCPWTIRGQDLGAYSLVSPEVSAVSISRRPATPQEVEAALGRLAASLAARSPLAGSSTTATDPAEAVPGRQGDARYGTAGTDPADTPRRPSPARRTPRSTDAPSAPYGPADSCPAPAAPSLDQVLPPDPAAARSTGSGTAHHPAAAASPLKPPYREGRQPVGPGVEREPDGTPGTTVRERDETRCGRCSQQPTADGPRPRYGEAPGL
ncbi:hypothetical protein SVIOM74S_05424 [Streptomyces violarus]